MHVSGRWSGYDSIMLSDCLGVRMALQLGVLYVDDKKGMKRAQRCLYALDFSYELGGHMLTCWADCLGEERFRLPADDLE